ncbi:hypothetical protein RD792_016408 [Penstemon davidsonii]|uniref:BZIP domain-containing protein n=1 Tax=Penstemon davidsonii TaxID=160366 RepID=A0ABR0CK70_9LAMI|nr:hypothetical protein RD792_016408 [Penstemon davidsonii]
MIDVFDLLLNSANVEEMDGNNEETNTMQILESSVGSVLPKQQQNHQPHVMNQLEIPQFHGLQNRQLSPNMGSIGIPPSHPRIPLIISPYSQIPVNRHVLGESLSSRKFHRRSYSDIPSTIMQSSPPLKITNGSQPVQLVQRKIIRGETRSEMMGENKSDQGGVVDDFHSIYMNLDNINEISNTGDQNLGNENWEDHLESGGARGSSDNGTINSVVGGDVVPRHYRSVSVDSFMGEMNFTDDEPPKMFPSPTNSIDSLEFVTSEISEAEMKKIMADDRLSKIATNDPKRAKRMLSNREAAARSKERKMKYIAELEQKVQALQTKATTLSVKLTQLQSESAALTSHNNKLKYRLQAMNQQSQLRNALDEALTAEIQRLKYSMAASRNQQISINCQMYQLHQQQVSQLNMHQLQQQQDQQQPSNDNTPTNNGQNQ